MDEGEVMEGFICPICYNDCKTAVQLNHHFQEQHAKDQFLFKSVKDMYEKAKKKILSKEIIIAATESEPSGYSKGTPGYFPSSVNPEIGASKSHLDFFKTVRAMRIERYAVQTNNLLIRLDKLLLNLPTDPAKRKAHEQDIVPWLNDKDVKLCPGCAKAFGILKRKHHCRLCGAVMCSDCSFQLPLDTARKMTSTSLGSSSTSENTDTSQSKSDTAVKKLLRSPSSASVQSVLLMDLTSESFFRLCEHCFKLLEIHEKLKEVRNQKPIVCQFYEKYRNSINEANPLIETYTKMYNSIIVGETTYNVMDAQSVRVKIVKLAENIDLISRKIAILGQNTENPPQGSQLLLQKTIRNAAAQYLKENIITLPSLPSEEEIQKAQEQRRFEIARKIEEERQISLEALQRSTPNSETRYKSMAGLQSPYQSKDPKIVVEDGWTPDVSQTIVSDNPVVQQINLIQAYIRQASEAKKMDEVATLEKNLEELKDELWRLNRVEDDERTMNQ